MERTWPADWEARRAGERCPMCAEGRGDQNGLGDLRVLETAACDAYLRRTAIVPGYTVVVWRGRHVADVTELSDADAGELDRAVRAVARAVERHYRPAKLNLLTLGNAVPHLHVHIVPRYLTDPDPGRPPRFMMVDPPPGQPPLIPEDAYVADIDALRRLVDDFPTRGRPPASPARHPEPVTLKDAWESEARNWVAWARRPGHDSYWQFHRDRFLELLPPPDGLVLDLGCGEGRLPRDLKARGYEVVGIDGSPTLIEHARSADPDGDYRVADGASLPLAEASVKLVTAFMSLHDIDDMDGAVRDAARVLEPGGRLCAAVVHPINSGGAFDASTHDAAFVMRDSYFERRRYADTVERDGLRMTFTSRHQPLEAYFAALEAAGLLVERLVEVADTTAPPGDRWQRIPLFLHLRAVKP